MLGFPLADSDLAEEVIARVALEKSQELAKQERAKNKAGAAK